MYGIIQGKISLIEFSSEKGNENNFGNSNENLFDLFKISEEPSKIYFLQSRRGLRNTRIIEGDRNNNPLFLTNFYKRLQEKILNGVGKRTELLDGMFFGEIDLINRRKRSHTAYAAEDTDLIYIDKENFEMTLYKTISKAESERIVFVFNMIPIFNNLPKKKFDEFFQQAVEFVTYKENEIIYEEGEKSEYIYLIYQGECCLKRDISKPYIFTFDEEAYLEEFKTIKMNSEKTNVNNSKNANNHTRNPSEWNINKNNGDNLLQNPTQNLDQNLIPTSLNFSNASVINSNSHYNMIDYPKDRIRSTIRVNNKIDLTTKMESKGNSNETDNKSENSNKYFQNKNKSMETILIINPGDASGLEGIAGLKRLNHTLVSTNPFTVIAKINLNKISDYKQRISEYFLPIYKEKEKIIENFVKSHRVVKFKMGLKYSGRNNLKELTSHISTNNDINKQLQKEFDSELEEKVKLMIEEVQMKKSKGQRNKKDTKFFSIDKIELDANLLRRTLDKNSFRSQKSKNSLHSRNFSQKSDSFLKNTNPFPINDNISKLEVSDLMANRNLRRNTKISHSIISRQSNSASTKILEKEKDIDKVVSFSKSPIKTNFKIFDNSISLFSNDKSQNCPRDVLKSYKLSKNALFNTNNNDQIKSLKHNKIRKENTLIESENLHKKHLSYHTGNFDMPLISNDMENYLINNQKILRLQKEIHKNKETIENNSSRINNLVNRQNRDYTFAKY